MALAVERLSGGIWRWTTPHPEWTPDEGGPDGWEPDVACLYLETGGGVLLIDPLVPTDAADRETFLRHLDADVERVDGGVTIALTCGAHQRSAGELAARYAAPVYAPAPHRADMGELALLPLADGDELVGGVIALVTDDTEEAEAVYQVAWRRALVAGDLLLADEHGRLRVAPASWYDQTEQRKRWYRDSLPGFLARLADLEPGAVLPAHGAPVLAGVRETLAAAAAG